MRKVITALLTGSALFLFTACGGGSSSSGTDNPPVTQESAAGLWLGTITSDNGTIYDGFALITEDGEVRLGTQQNGAYVSQANGYITVNGNQASATLDIYYSVPGSTFTAVKDPSSPTLTLAGTVSTENTLSGSYTSAYDSGTFSMSFNTLYNDDSSLAKIQGNYYNPIDGFDGYIDADGYVTGHYTSSGCDITGKISIINSAVNVYDATITGTCPNLPTVTLDGIAGFSPNGGDHLTLFLSNENASTYPQFLKY